MGMVVEVFRQVVSSLQEKTQELEGGSSERRVGIAREADDSRGGIEEPRRRFRRSVRGVEVRAEEERMSREDGGLAR